MSVYSKAYQTVIAGRVREDEGIAYFGTNEVTTPAGGFVMTRADGDADKEVPLIAENLQNEEVGKQRSATGGAILGGFASGSNNANKIV